MGLYLIAAAAESGLVSFFNTLYIIFMVALGLGFVIFVHELGHFLVAKACGVQCDKFFIGFDVPIRIPLVGKLINLLLAPVRMAGIAAAKVPDPIPLPAALFRKKWGETEYGIGIIPLGGYVKMLGQDDNPAKMAEEMERARVSKEHHAEDAKHPEHAPTDSYELNPRSYLAKSVPQRMAIISAGVIMNVIFAFIFATIAYMIGVSYQPSVVGGTLAGSPAWESGLMPGDDIVRVGKYEKPRFQDLRSSVLVGDAEVGQEIDVVRGNEKFSMTLHPDTKRNGGIPSLGVMTISTLTIGPEPFAPGSAASKSVPPLEAGDVIIEANGKPVAGQPELQAILVANASKPLHLLVDRTIKSEKEGEAPKTRKVDIVIPPQPVRNLGMVMQMGRISGVQAGSPAALAGLKADDMISKIDNQPVGDPMEFAGLMLEAAEKNAEVLLTIERQTEFGASDAGDKAAKDDVKDSSFKQSKPETINITVRPRMPRWTEVSIAKGVPASAPALGIAFRVGAVVEDVAPNSPAAMVDPPIIANEQVLLAKIIPAPNEDPEIASLQKKEEFKFGDSEGNWPCFSMVVQTLPVGAKVELTIQSPGGKTRQVVLEPAEVEGLYYADRGIRFEPLERIRKADSLGEAISLGAGETKEALLMVYRFLQRLVERKLPATAMGGPITIFQSAAASARAGESQLLIFLTMLSANLAVVNFLPIPLLDGGHMVLLAWEGIFRRPANERVIVALHTIGFVFIIGLMLFVISLDLGIISRGF